MRVFFGILGVLLCSVSIALAARYGYKGADTVTDGVISAVVFGFIALCACVFDAAAVRLWFMRHRWGAIVVGLIASAALVVTFTNSLGAIAGRADITQAERTATKDDAATERAELKRITAERTAMGAFTPADAEAVSAARAAVTSAERTRSAECGNGDPRQRGSNCRLRETEEQVKRDALATVLVNKALSEKAAKLDSQAAGIRDRLKKLPPVQNANPLGAALEQIIGGAAAALTAWQQAVVAGVFELCLVGVMVIYELLGQDGRKPAPEAPATRSSVPLLGRLLRWRRALPNAVAEAPAAVIVERVAIVPRALPTPRKAKPPARARAPGNDDPASIHAYVRQRLEPAAGHDTNMRDVLTDYVTWCEQQGATPKSKAEFAEAMDAACKRERIAIEPKAGKVVCCNVKLAGAHEPAAVRAEVREAINSA